LEQTYLEEGDYIFVSVKYGVTFSMRQ